MLLFDCSSAKAEAEKNDPNTICIQQQQEKALPQPITISPKRMILGR
jgi:hypothetical protein